jgi:hypothetical protein
MKTSSLVLSLLLSFNAFAGVLTVETGSKVIEGVKLFSTATVKSETSEVKLDFLGAGLRTKKVLVDMNVYVVQVLSDNATKFVRTEAGALDSVASMNTVAFTLTFLRDVDAKKVMESFDEAFNANEVDQDVKGVKEFLAAVRAGGAAENTKTMTILLQKKSNGTVAITYEGTNGVAKTVIGAAESLKIISSIWLGESADSGLLIAKKSIIKGQ